MKYCYLLFTQYMLWVLRYHWFFRKWASGLDCGLPYFQHLLSQPINTEFSEFNSQLWIDCQVLIFVKTRAYSQGWWELFLHRCLSKYGWWNVLLAPHHFLSSETYPSAVFTLKFPLGIWISWNCLREWNIEYFFTRY